MQTPPNDPHHAEEEPRKLTPEEQARADRIQWILYGVMAVFIFAPFVAWYIFKR